MNEKEARRLAELRVKAKQGFKIHLLVYLLINAFSWLNHLLAGTDQSPIYTTVYWGIGLAIHWFVTYIGSQPQKYEDKVEAELKRIKFD